MHKAQTKSRLFRPWDTNADNCSSTSTNTNNNNNKNNNNNCNNCNDSMRSSTPEPPTIPTGADIKSEEPNISSAYAGSCSDCAPPTRSSSRRSSRNCSILHAHPNSKELYYATDAKCEPLTLPLTNNSAVFGMDLMEQEYAPTVAEDAHFKALNARKQRPKKFKCPLCDLAFSYNSQLKGHIRIHIGVRPFQCDVTTCGKTYARNYELTRHKRVHTGIRPYACIACGKKFGEPHHLKKHMKTHGTQDR